MDSTTTTTNTTQDGDYTTTTTTTTNHITSEWWEYVPAKTVNEAEKKAEAIHQKTDAELQAEKERYSKETFDRLMNKAQAQIERYNGNNIDPSLNDYIDKKDGLQLNDDMFDATEHNDAIIYKGADGKSLFELVPSSRIERKTIVPVDDFNMIDSPTFEYSATGQDSFQQMNVPDNDEKEKRDMLQYSFGLDEVTVAKKQINKTSGFISKPIDIGSCYHIELIAPAYDGLEYSIIENGIETPILPKDQDKIKDEKIFFGLPLRFPVEEIDTVAIKANGTLTSYRYDDIKTLQANGNKDYTVDYTPVQNAHYYSPKSKKIQVKVVQRLQGDNTPKPIEQILIRVYGGKTNWTMQA